MAAPSPGHPGATPVDAGRSYVTAAATVAVAAAIRQLLDPALGEHHLFVPFLFPPIFVATRFGWRPAAFALVLGMLAANVLFAKPRLSVWVEEPRDQIGLLLYLAVGSGGVYLAEARRRAEGAGRPARPPAGPRLRPDPHLDPRRHHCLLERRGRAALRLHRRGGRRPRRPRPPGHGVPGRTRRRRRGTAARRPLGGGGAPPHEVRLPGRRRLPDGARGGAGPTGPGVGGQPRRDRGPAQGGRVPRRRGADAVRRRSRPRRHHHHRRGPHGCDFQPRGGEAVRLRGGGGDRAERQDPDARAVPRRARRLRRQLPADRRGEDHRHRPRGRRAAQGRHDLPDGPGGRRVPPRPTAASSPASSATSPSGSGPRRNSARPRAGCVPSWTT